MEKWFVIYCKFNQESKAYLSLKNSGLQVYRPLMLCPDSRSNSKLKPVSLFPRYLFLKADPEKDSLFRAKYSPGVLKFVSFSGRYSTIDQSVIDDIRCQEKYFNINKKLGESGFKKGDSISVDINSNTNIQGAFLEAKESGRIVVLLNILNKATPVVVSPENVRLSI